jgi:hypothetical protein
MKAQIDEAVKITTLEWLVHWTWEKFTGRTEYPEPVLVDEDCNMSVGVRVLSDRYRTIRSIYPSIFEKKFRWEQIDGWDIGIQLHEDPYFIIGGSRARYRPAVHRWVQCFNEPSQHLLWCLCGILFGTLSAHLLKGLISSVESGVQGADLLLTGVCSLVVLSVSYVLDWLVGHSERG